MAVARRRPALIAGLTALLLSVPTAALAQPGRPAGTPRAAAVARAWQTLHRTKGVPLPAWLAGRPHTAPHLPKLAPTALAGELADVAAVSATRAWAVGYRCASGCGSASEVDRTLALHWNGSTWSQASPASPNPSSARNSLDGVAAVSDTSVWAVGSYCASSCGGSSGTEVDKGLLLHWNGRTWKRYPAVNSGPLTVLASVTARSASDVWAAGITCTKACARILTLTEHWNGKTWSKVPSPNPDKALNVLNSISSRTARNAWAGGFSGSGNNLMLRWNGKKWAAAAVPSPGKVFSAVAAVAAQSSKNAWAVGSFCSGCGNTAGVIRPLALHWNGAKWSRVASPALASGGGQLNGVAAKFARSTWAVGSSCVSGCGTTSEVDGPLIDHWNGKKWSLSATPGSSAAVTVLIGVSADSAGDAWTVGYTCAASCGQAGEIDSTLILRWDSAARSWLAG